MKKTDVKIAEILHLERPLCAIDIETTGLNPSEDRIIQVGAVMCYPDGRVEEGSQLIDPEMPLSEDSKQTHRLSDEDLKGKPTWKDVGPQTAEGLRTADVCAYNGKFDLSFIRSSCARDNIPFDPGLLVDPYVIYKTRMRHTLASAVAYYLLNNGKRDFQDVNVSQEAHDALWDARAAIIVLQAQLETYQDLPRTVRGLHGELFGAAPGYLDADRKFKLIDNKPHVCFGKFGRPPTPFDCVPLDYFEWMLRTDFSDSTKEVIKNHVKIPVAQSENGDD
jgi:DNA polymerase-3 subunit epsilon